MPPLPAAAAPFLPAITTIPRHRQAPDTHRVLERHRETRNDPIPLEQRRQREASTPVRVAPERFERALVDVLAERERDAERCVVGFCFKNDAFESV